MVKRDVVETRIVVSKQVWDLVKQLAIIKGISANKDAVEEALRLWLDKEGWMFKAKE